MIQWYSLQLDDNIKYKFSLSSLQLDDNIKYNMK